MSNNALTALVLAALDDSGLKALEERVTELAEIGFKPVIVNELPETGEENTLYLVPQQEPGEDPWYKEYMWLDNQWELIGTTSVDFSDYYTSNDVDNLLANYYTQSEVDELVNQTSEEITNLSEDITNIENNITNIEGDITNLGDNITNIEGDITNIQSDITNLGDSITGVETDLSALEAEVATKARKDKFFDGVSEDWDQFTTEEKVYRLVSAVEDYVTLDISETYSINAAVGLDPQDEIISDMYEDEIIDMTNEIIGGNG